MNNFRFDQKRRLFIIVAKEDTVGKEISTIKKKPVLCSETIGKTFSEIKVIEPITSSRV